MLHFAAHVSGSGSHLQNEAFARQAVCKHWVIVIVVKDSDEGCARGAAGWGASILNQHYELVTWLLLSVQNSLCTHFTWRDKQKGAELCGWMQNIRKTDDLTDRVLLFGLIYQL